MIRREFLERVERSLPDGMGNNIIYYNNLYATNFNILQRTDDGQFPVYEWWAEEEDPRTGLKREYSHNTLDSEGNRLGVVNNSINLFAGVKSKVAQIVTTSPGDELIIE